MILRAMNPEDLSQLPRLCRAHAAHEGLAFVESGQAERWREALFGPRPRLFGWVCEADAALVGYMTATIDYSTWSARPFVYLDCLYLEPQARGQGLGRRAMAVLEAFAIEQGCAEIQWQTPPDNDLGLGFYRAIGARELPKARFTLPVAAS